MKVRNRGTGRLMERAEARASTRSARRRRHRRPVAQPDAAEARQLHGGMAQVEAGDQAEKIDLDPFDPTELHAEQPPQRRLDAGSAVGQAEIGMSAEILAYRIRWQRDAELRYRAEQGGDEGVAVRSRPRAVVAQIVVGVTGDGRLDLGNERRRLCSAYIGEHARDVAEPAPVRFPAVAVHGSAPAEHVVAGPGGGALGLVHDPAVDGENAPPAPQAAGKDKQARLVLALAGGSMPTLDQSASARLPARSSRAESAAWTTSGERNKARIPTSTLRERERMGDLVREVTLAFPHRATARLCRSRRIIRTAETVCFPPE